MMKSVKSKLMAVRMGPWKIHFSTKEDHYSQLSPRTISLIFNIRRDPFESYDTKNSYGHLATQKACGYPAHWANS
jgi:arylsulfatase